LGGAATGPGLWPQGVAREVVQRPGDGRSRWDVHQPVVEVVGLAVGLCPVRFRGQHASGMVCPMGCGAANTLCRSLVVETDEGHGEGDTMPP